MSKSKYIIAALMLLSIIGAAIGSVKIDTSSNKFHIPIKQNNNQEDTASFVQILADLTSKRGANDSAIYLNGNVAFHHNGAIIECDSAKRYSDTEMECFGNVIINKDSAYIYGDRAIYNSKTNQVVVYSPLIKMKREDATLLTYNMTFNTKTNIAHYSGGGLMVQEDNIMESNSGNYNAKTHVVRFLDDVEMRTKDFVVKTDSLDYNMDNEIATFLTHTVIWEKDSTILKTDKGMYDTKNETYYFTENAYLMNKEQEMWADTMSYYTPVKQATMTRNVQVLDTVQRTIAFGDWAHYDDSMKIAILARKPSVRAYNEQKNDTTYMRSDTILMNTYDAEVMKFVYDTILFDPRLDSTLFDSTAVKGHELLDSLPIMHDDMTLDTTQMDSTIVDSLKQITPPEIKIKTDTIYVIEEHRIIKAFHDVKVWSTDAQMICDSMTAFSIDSLIKLNGNPILWSETSQITSDSIIAYTKDGELDWIEFIGKPFVTQAIEPKQPEPADTSRFNQASGKEMYAYFKNNEIDSVQMKGNVVNYYYMLEGDGEYTSAFAVIECADLDIFFEKRQVVKMKWIGQSEWEMFDINQIPAEQSQQIAGFNWDIKKRPKSAKEISNRTARKSERQIVSSLTKPMWAKEKKILSYREILMKNGTWRDRDDLTNRTVNDFKNNYTEF